MLVILDFPYTVQWNIKFIHNTHTKVYAHTLWITELKFIIFRIDLIGISSISYAKSVKSETIKIIWFHIAFHNKISVKRKTKHLWNEWRVIFYGKIWINIKCGLIDPSNGMKNWFLVWTATVTLVYGILQGNFNYRNFPTVQYKFLKFLEKIFIEFKNLLFVKI